MVYTTSVYIDAILAIVFTVVGIFCIYRLVNYFEEMKKK